MSMTIMPGRLELVTGGDATPPLPLGALLGLEGWSETGGSYGVASMAVPGDTGTVRMNSAEWMVILGDKGATLFLQFPSAVFHGRFAGCLVEFWTRGHVYRVGGEW